MSSFVTRSRRGDLLLMLAIAALMLAFAGRLRVYHEVPRWALERAAEPGEESSPPPRGGTPP